MTTKSGGIALAMALAMGLVGSSLQAQVQSGSDGGGRQRGPNMGRSLEMIIEHQEDLEITGDQLSQLQALKATMDQAVTPLAEEMKALREQIWAGDIDREDGMRQMQALRGRFITASAPLQGRVQEILTVEQHRKLQPMVYQGGRNMGRGGAFQGRGGASQGRMGRGSSRGQMRGSRGGFGPRMGNSRQGRASASGFCRSGQQRSVPQRMIRGRSSGRGGGWDPTPAMDVSGGVSPKV